METFGFDEWERAMRDSVENYEAKKQHLLNRMGRIYQGEVMKLSPVDTGRLRASITTEVKDSDSVMVGTNVEYAKFVNDGHKQTKRWLPCRLVNGRIVYDAEAKTGVMLQAKYIPGTKFFEKALYQAKPRLNNEIEIFVRELTREVEGGK